MSERHLERVNGCMRVVEKDRDIPIYGFKEGVCVCVLLDTQTNK